MTDKGVKVSLRSTVYGEEEFEYDSLTDALNGIERLYVRSVRERAGDQIDREIVLRVEGPDSE